jgi:hypothetical protein
MHAGIHTHNVALCIAHIIRCGFESTGEGYLFCHPVAKGIIGKRYLGIILFLYGFNFALNGPFNQIDILCMVTNQVANDIVLIVTCLLVIDVIHNTACLHKCWYPFAGTWLF